MSDNPFLLRWGGHVRRMGAAYLVLAISLVPTFLAYHRVLVSVAERDQARFDQTVALTQETIERRIERDVDEFLAMRGFFDVAGLPDRAGHRTPGQPFRTAFRRSYSASSISPRANRS